MTVEHDARYRIVAEVQRYTIQKELWKWEVHCVCEEWGGGIDVEESRQ
jgi:hypothetical protein